MVAALFITFGCDPIAIVLELQRGRPGVGAAEGTAAETPPSAAEGFGHGCDHYFQIQARLSLVSRNGQVSCDQLAPYCAHAP